MHHRLVIVESPYRGENDEQAEWWTASKNEMYARAATRDCIDRGESPYASHLLLTQPGILKDTVPAERAIGIAAGLAWYRFAEAAVFYCDNGVSPGMVEALEFITEHRPAAPVEWRFLKPPEGGEYFYFGWRTVFGSAMNAGHTILDVPEGRFDVERLGKSAPTAQAPYQVRFRGALVAHYADRETAQAGAEAYYLWRFSSPGAKAVKHLLKA